MINGIQSESNSSQIVTPYYWSREDRNMKITKKMSNPNKIRYCVRQGTILSFCRRSSNRCLFICRPRDQVIAQKNAVACPGFSPAQSESEKARECKRLEVNVRPWDNKTLIYQRMRLTAAKPATVGFCICWETTLTEWEIFSLVNVICWRDPTRLPYKEGSENWESSSESLGEPRRAAGESLVWSHSFQP